jgi:RNA polymerase sigma-70 factor (ECF subfamily)
MCGWSAAVDAATVSGMNPESETAPKPLADGLFPVELREGLARREAPALARFFDVYFERVHAYLRRLVADEHLAEDLTQEVFLAAHRALASYDPARDPRPWLFTIATNKLRDHWRARAGPGAGALTSLDHEELSERVGAAQPEPDGLDRAVLAQRVRAAIDALPGGLRATVLLRVYEGLSFEDIGRILERNEAAARKRYSRALSALREELGALWRAEVGGRG